MAEEILLVDDRAAIRRSFGAMLQAEGYTVRTACDGDEAVAAIKEKLPDLILLDIDMPRKNGFTACKEMRTLGVTRPIIFLSASLSECDEVRALTEGADDFIKKTDPQSIILARIRRALDRKQQVETSISTAAVFSRTLILNGITIDFNHLTIKGENLDERLTKTEGDLLWLLNSQRGQVVSYDEIFEVLRGSDYVGDDRTLHVYMSHLRKKMGAAADALQNHRGTGYSLKVSNANE